MCQGAEDLLVCPHGRGSQGGTRGGETGAEGPSPCPPTCTFVQEAGPGALPPLQQGRPHPPRQPSHGQECHFIQEEQTAGDISGLSDFTSCYIWWLFRSWDGEGGCEAGSGNMCPLPLRWRAVAHGGGAHLSPGALCAPPGGQCWARERRPTGSLPPDMWLDGRLAWKPPHSRDSQRPREGSWASTETPAAALPRRPSSRKEGYARNRSFHFPRHCLSGGCGHKERDGFR